MYPGKTRKSLYVRPPFFLLSTKSLIEIPSPSWSAYSVNRVSCVYSCVGHGNRHSANTFSASAAFRTSGFDDMVKIDGGGE